MIREAQLAWNVCVGSFSNSKPLFCSFMAFPLAACWRRQTTTSRAERPSSLVTVAWYFQYSAPVLVSATSRLTAEREGRDHPVG
jgi:hypothetical protein